MNNKQIVIVSVLIISLIIGSFSLKKIFTSSMDFSDSFNEFSTPSELSIELERGVYVFYQVSNNTSNQEVLNIDYSITVKDTNPKTIEIAIGSKQPNQSIIKYTLQEKQFKSIGEVIIDEKQAVKIISTISDPRIDKLAYRINSDQISIFEPMKYSLLLILSGLGFLISLILIIRNRS